MWRLYSDINASGTTYGSAFGRFGWPKGFVSRAHRIFWAAAQGVLYLRVASEVTCVDNGGAAGGGGAICGLLVGDAVTVVQLSRCTKHT